ncbi:hypothetical protein LMG19083_02551 [Ralstonia psammae]|uniref:Multidrug ABC transporter ATPase n=1 Tax=Ralstonia psammae TaxID=3058598 RepID=A0ABN9IVL1_9RALS|nr:hypothetical protein [Ralstonia sp. LMG 19083]CAJ0794245.1 hypothetical protein LMG19083_02551 [Ralstonia sp. LMG 19083]
MNHARLTQLLCIAGLLLATQTIHAAEDACTAQMEGAIKRAYPAAKRLGRSYKIDDARVHLPEAFNPHAVVCRTWPAHPELVLMAVPLMRQEDTEAGTNEGDLDLFVLDTSNGSIRQRLHLPARMSDDAVRIRSVTFDTARYVVAPGQLAFGVRIAKEGSSRPNPFNETDLWLYTVQGAQLKPVLNGVIVETGGGEWDTNCAGTFEQTKRTLTMASDTHNGYADIAVSEIRSSSTSTVDKAGECQTRDAKPQRTTYRLAYDGKQYVVPKALVPLD